MVESEVADRIRTVFAVAILILGSIGNVLSLIVMQRRSLRCSSASFYFSMIAITDTLLIYSGLVPVWIKSFGGVEVFGMSPWSCRWGIFLIFTSGDLAVWLLVGVTGDRFISVRFPMKAKIMCTIKRAQIVSLCLAVTAVVKNAHLFWTRGTHYERTVNITENHCGYPTHEYEHFEVYIRSWIAFTLYAFIPIFSVFVMNLLIIQGLKKLQRVHPGNGTSIQEKESNSKRNVTQMTKMFLSVSIVFLMLITPSIAIRVSWPHWSTDPHKLAARALLSAVADSMAYLNHAINFLLYCVSGKRFRAELIRLFRIDKKDETNNTTAPS